MPKASKKVRTRAEEVDRLLRENGCISLRHVAALGFTKTQAESALKYLMTMGRAVRVRVGRVALWCADREAAESHVARLKEALRAAVCAAGVRYVTPRRALEIIAKNKEARELLTRYVRLNTKDTAALHLVNGLLTAAYGRPKFRKRGGSMPVYLTDCFGGARGVRA